MLSDLNTALRRIAKSPGYSAVVVLTLACGIAVSTQIFSTISAMFLQPLAVRDADRLVSVFERSDLINLPHGLSFPDIQDLRSGSKALTDFVASFPSGAHVSIPGRTPERAWIEAVTPDAFDVLGVTTVLGRPLQPADGETSSNAPVAVLTYPYWQSHFGGDAGVVGRTVIINNHPVTIVGVARPGFESCSWSLSVALFVPSGASASLLGGDYVLKERADKAWRLFARLRPGASLADANAQLGVIALRLGKDFPDSHRHSRFSAVPERRARPDPSTTDFMPQFVALFLGLVLLVLLIACANVTNLMGARALSRERELTVRSALGASRGRLVRLLVVESLVLASIAGLVGYILSVWMGDVVQQFIPTGDVPIRRNPPEGWQVFAFTAAVSLAAGLAAGLLPALRSSRINLAENLKQGSGQLAGIGRHRIRDMLVIGQVAVSCIVLVAAAQFMRGLGAARGLQLGFNADRLLVTGFDLGMQGYTQERGMAFQRQLLERVSALPGVESAGLTLHLPFSYRASARDVWPDQPTAHVPDDHTSVFLSAVSPGFLRMFGVPLLRGRDLAKTDDEKAPLVAVINEAMAKAFWPGRDPVGQHFRLERGGAAIEVVGVVATGKYVMLTEDPRPYYYVPLAQRYDAAPTLVIRTSLAPAALAAGVRGAVRELDPNLPLSGMISLDEHLATSVFALMPLHTGALLAGIQGVVGLLLSLLGLYAVVAYNVGRRTREIGVRMALGASQADVLRLVSRDGMRLTLIGAIAGIVVAVGLSFGLSRVVYGVRALDAVAFLGTLALLVGTAALACWLPARRATRVDPMIALRAE